MSDALLRQVNRDLQSYRELADLSDKTIKELRKELDTVRCDLLEAKERAGRCLDSRDRATGELERVRAEIRAIKAFPVTTTWGHAEAVARVKVLEASTAEMRATVADRDNTIFILLREKLAMEDIVNTLRKDIASGGGLVILLREKIAMEEDTVNTLRKEISEGQTGSRNREETVRALMKENTDLKQRLTKLTGAPAVEAAMRAKYEVFKITESDGTEYIDMRLAMKAAITAAREATVTP